MSLFLTTAAVLRCSFGSAPSVLVADELPGAPRQTGLATATILQSVPLKNVMPFGSCSSMANPTVSAATAAAQGVLTPMPCLPGAITPWAPGSLCASHLGVSLAHADAVCACAFGGAIKVDLPNPTSAQTL